MSLHPHTSMMEVTDIHRPPFFTGFLHPSLLTVSPLQQIVDYLNDSDIHSFCMSSHDTHLIWPRMVLKEAHQFTEQQSKVIVQRRGPSIRCIQLDQLTDLAMIPESMRNQIKEVRFEKIGGTVAPDLIPTKLEVFTSVNNTHGYVRYLRGPELPVLPSTIRQFCFGFHMNRRTFHGIQEEEKKEEDQDESSDNDAVGVNEEVDRKQKSNKNKPIPPADSDEQVYESATHMIKRVLRQATQLTDVSISIDGGELIGALPSTIERLSVHMYCREVGRSWPQSLKHLRIETDIESQIELDAFIPPIGLISLEMPFSWLYHHYDATMVVVSQMESLREIVFGPGISSSSIDLFASLPRNITQVLYLNNMMLEPSHTTDVNSLPDSVDDLCWLLNNTEVRRWPSQLRKLTIMGDAFAQDIQHLPNTLQTLRLPDNYIRPVSKWPNNLIELSLGMQFMDIPSAERLPSTIRTLAISLPLARRLMKSGKLPQNLTRLYLFGHPSPRIPFDLSSLPISLQTLTFDIAGGGDRPLLIGRDERPNLHLRFERLSQGICEEDMEASILILNDPNMSSPIDDDPEETMPFIPMRDDDWRAPNRQPDPTELQSHQLFYTEPDYNLIYKELAQVHELCYVPRPSALFDPAPSVPEFLDRLSNATKDQPIHGLSIKEAKSAPLVRAARDALLAGKVVGNFSMIECKSAPPEKEPSSWTKIGDGPRVEVPPPPSPFTFLPDDYDPIKAADVMIQLLAALPHSKISRIKIDRPRPLFDPPSKPPIESKENDDQPRISIGFSTFCTSISRMSSLRTLVFRNCYSYSCRNIFSDTPDQMELLTRTILESPSIENVDFGDNTLGLGLTSVIQLIQQTKTLKRLVLSGADIQLGGIYQICEAVIENESLVSLNLAGNRTSLAGLNVIRHALRHNRRIEITVCHLDFGSTGLDQLRQKRHRRLKESRRVYTYSVTRGHDMELQ